MARNKYPGYCYECGKYVPPGFGHFERNWKWRKLPKNGGANGHCRWRIHCVKCASGRTVKDTDYEVQRIREELKAEKNNGKRTS